MLASFTDPQRVDITKARWTATVTITDSDGNEHKYIASADSGLTYGDGLYFSDAETYAEDLAERGF